MGTLKMKRIYEEVEPSDGRRILVDRLWPRGMKKERAKLDVWAKEITPSPELRKLYHTGGIPFEGFAADYLDELEASDEAKAFVEKPATISRKAMSRSSTRRRTRSRTTCRCSCGG